MRKYILFFILLGAFVLVAYEALIWYDTNFRYGRMWETPAVRPLEQPPLTMQAGGVPFGGGEEIYKVTPAETLRTPFPGKNPETLSLGKALYVTYCAQCHGKNYDGNGTVGQSFFPLPTDLRSAKVQALSDGAFFKEISYGIPGGRQPPLATTVAPRTVGESLPTSSPWVRAAHDGTPSRSPVRETSGHHRETVLTTGLSGNPFPKSLQVQSLGEIEHFGG